MAKKLSLQLSIMVLLALLTFTPATFAQQNNDLDRGRELLKNGKYDEAIEAYQKYLQQTDKDAWRAYYGMALAHYNLKKYEESLQLFQKSITLNPKTDALSSELFQNAYRFSGNIYYLAQDYKNAVTAYEKVVELNPQVDETVFILLGIAYRDSGQYEKAITTINKAIQLKPTNDDYKKELAIAQNMAKYDEQNKLGRQYFKDKDWKQSAKAFQTAADLFPSASIYFNLGQAYYNSGDYTKAVAAFEETLRLDSNLPNAKEYLATAQKAKKEEKEGKKAAWMGVLGAVVDAVDTSGKTSVSESSQSNNQTQRNGRTENSAITPGKYAFRRATFDGSSNLPAVTGYLLLNSDGTYEHPIWIGRSPGGCGPGTYSISGSMLSLKPNSRTNCSAQEWSFSFDPQTNTLILQGDGMTLTYSLL